MKQRFIGGPFGGQTLEVGAYGDKPVLVLGYPRPTYEHQSETDEFYELIAGGRFHFHSRPSIAAQVKAKTYGPEQEQYLQD